MPASKPYTALFVPERALATDQDIKFVYVVGPDGIAVRRDVELGAQRGDMRVIKAGVQAGERVIVKGLQLVRTGQKIEVEEAAAVAAPTATPDASNSSPAPATPPAGQEP